METSHSQVKLQNPYVPRFCINLPNTIHQAPIRVRKLVGKVAPKQKSSYRSTKTEVIRRLFQRRSEPNNAFRSRKLIIHTSQMNKKPSILYDTSDYCISPKAFIIPAKRQSSCRKLDCSIKKPTHKEAPNPNKQAWDEIKSQKFIDIYQTLIIQRNLHSNNSRRASITESDQFAMLRIKKVKNENDPLFPKTENASPMSNFVTKKDMSFQNKAHDCIVPKSQTKKGDPNNKVEAIMPQHSHAIQLSKENKPKLVRSQSTKGSKMSSVLQMQEKFFDEAELTPWE